MDTSGRRNRLEALEQQESILESIEAHLQRQIADTARQLKTLRLEKASLAPVNMLPDDVLVQVLEHLYLHHFPHCGAVNDQLLHSPITISHVSRRWRLLALSLPSIWKCVHVTLHPPRHCQQIIGLYLTRSQALPLSLFFVTLSAKFVCSPDLTWRQFSASPQWHHLWECWCTVRKEIHRWKQCAFYFILPEIMEAIQDTLLDARMPLLQFLQVYAWPGLDLHPSTLSLGWASQRLTHMRLFNVITPLLRPLLDSVVELSIHDALFTVDSFRMLSKAAPCLKNLIFSDIVVEQEDSEEPDVEFPVLRSLTLDLCDIDLVLPYLRAPELETLSISLPGVLGTLASKVPSPNYPRLRELRCINCVLLDVSHLMSSLSGVVTLDLGYSDAAEYLTSLQDANGALLPKLQTLVLSRLEDSSPLLLQEFAQSRSVTTCPLRTIYIGSPLSLEIERDLVGSLESLGISVRYTMCADFPRDFWDEEYHIPLFHRGFSLVPQASGLSAHH